MMTLITVMTTKTIKRMAILPIEMILLGIVTDVILSQELNALSAIEVYFDGIITDPIGQLNQAAYDASDDGIIDVGRLVLPKANPSNHNDK